MKKYFANIRIIEAENVPESIHKIEMGHFIETHDLSDIVVPVEYVRVIKGKDINPKTPTMNTKEKIKTRYQLSLDNNITKIKSTVWNEITIEGTRITVRKDNPCPDQPAVIRIENEGSAYECNVSQLCAMMQINQDFCKRVR